MIKDQKDLITNKENNNEDGNAIVIILVILVVAAVGVLAFMSGKMSGSQDIMASLSSGKKTDTKEKVAKETPESKMPNAGAVLAEVNGESITFGEVVAGIGNFPPQMQQMPQEQLIQIALQQMINNKLITQKAETAGLDNNEEVLEQLENAKKQIIRSKFVGDLIAEKMTDERIRSEYDQYVEAFEPQDQVTAAHILVEEEAKAKDIVKKLNEGGDFAALAKENSIDGTAENGGNLGSFGKADMVPEFAEAAFALEVGKYTKKPVKTQFGFHIIKVSAKGKSEPAPFEQIEPYIRQSLNQSILNEYIMGLNQESEIKRYDLQGNLIEPQKQDDAEAENAKEPAAGEEAQDAPAEEGAQ